MRAYTVVCCGLLVSALGWIPRPAESAPEELLVASGAPVPVAVEGEGVSLEAVFDGGLLVPIEGPLLAPASGDHWLAVAARDLAGHLSEVRWAFVRVDEGPPELHLESEPAGIEGAGDRLWTAAGARIVLRAEDAPAGVARTHLSVGERVVEVEGAEAVLDLPSGRDLTLRGWAEDRLGQRSAVLERPLAIDGEPPSCTIRIHGPWSLSGGRPRLEAETALRATASDTESGLARVEHWVDGRRVGEEGWHGPWAPGPHQAELVASDRVGHETRCELVFEVVGRPRRAGGEGGER